MEDIAASAGRNELRRMFGHVVNDVLVGHHSQTHSYGAIHCALHVLNPRNETMFPAGAL